MLEKSSNLPDKGVVPVATWLVSCEGCCYDGIDETNYEMWYSWVSSLSSFLVYSSHLTDGYYFPKRRTVFAYCATSIQKQIWFPTALILGKLQLLAILNLLPLTLLLDSDGDVDSRSVFGELSSSLEEG